MITLIHKRMVNCQIHPTKLKMKGITGQYLKLVGEANLDLTIEGTRLNHLCLITDSMQYDAIIGYDILKGGGYTVDFSLPSSAEGKEQTAHIKVNHNVEIAAYSRKYLSLSTNHKLDSCLEARVYPTKLSIHNVWVEDSICDLDSQGRVIVEVINDNPYPVHLERRTRVAKVKSYTGRRPVGDQTIKDWIEKEHFSPKSGTRKTINSCQTTPMESNNAARTRRICQQIDTTSLSATQRSLVYRLVGKCPQSFSLDGEELPATHLTQYTIPTGDAIPIRKRAYRIPECQKAPLKELLDKLTQEGIIQPSRSDWSAPLIMIPKKEAGKFRIVVDHRGLNTLLRRDNYPLPRIDDLLDNLKTAKRFTVLDLKSGFHQVPIHPDDVHKTAFVCAQGLFEFLRMSMGLANAPSCFQRMLESLFADMKALGVLIYIDDIIIYTETDEQHEILLEKVLKRLAQGRLSLKPDKCQFFKKQVSYLGHLVSEEGIYPLYENIKKVLTYPVPTNLKQLRGFVGLSSYYRKFVEKFAQIAKPLTELTKKEVNWTWQSEHQQAFDTLKNKLVNPPILQYPRYDIPFTLFTDASDNCIGAVLSQTLDGRERVVAYGSRCLNDAELNYSTSEKECLAIVYFLGEYRHYLLGRKFTIETDHAPLSFLNRDREPKGRLGRWALDLAEFDYVIKYRPGKININADAMSRMPVNQVSRGWGDSDDDDEPLEEPALSVPNLKRAQQKDSWCQAMIDYLRRKVLPVKDDNLAKRIVLNSPQYLIRGDGVLVVIPLTKGAASASQPVIMLPPALRTDAMRTLHDHFSAGHLGFEKTLKKIQQRFFWPQMYSEIEKYTKSCVSCARIKTPPMRRLAPHATFTQATRPMERLIIDFVGPISPASRNGSTVILVVTDAFTRFAMAYPMPHQKKELVAEILATRVFATFGSPVELHSDQGKNFMSKLMKELYKLYQVKHVRGSSYHPQSQGGVERQNRTLVESLKHYVQTDVFEWHTYVEHAIMAYNSSVHASTLHTPYELMFGRPMNLPLDAIIHKPAPVYKDIDGYCEETAMRLYIAHQNARRASEQARVTQAKYYDMRAKKRDFRVGDHVYITNEQKKAKKKHKNDCRKFRPSWVGPCLIIKQISNVVYVVVDLETRKKTTVHENRLKLAFGQARPEKTDSPTPPGAKPTRNLRSQGPKREKEVSDWYKAGTDTGSDSEDSGSDSDDSDLASDHGDDEDPPPPPGAPSSSDSGTDSEEEAPAPGPAGPDRPASDSEVEGDATQLPAPDIVPTQELESEEDQLAHTPAHPGEGPTLDLTPKIQRAPDRVAMTPRALLPPTYPGPRSPEGAEGGGTTLFSTPGPPK